MRPTTYKVPPKLAIQIICQELGTTPTRLRDRTQRDHETSATRQILCHFLYYQAGWTYARIGRLLDRDVSTVHYLVGRGHLKVKDGWWRRSYQRAIQRLEQALQQRVA